MYKLIGIILAAIPVVLFLRTIFTTQSKKRSQAVSNFKKQLDYLVWAILFLIGCEVVYLVGALIFN
jgi:putative exporter of polyketide antibiotics